MRAEIFFVPLAVFIATGKVFSPQYLIWLIPFVVLVPGRAGRWAIALFLSTLALTQVLFPYAYDHLLDRRGWAVVLLTIRNIFFLATIAAVAVAAREAQLPVMRRAQRMRREFVSGTVARRDRRA